MKALVAILTLALPLPAVAQYSPLPQTTTFFDNATKEIIGSVTVAGNRAYVRDQKGEHYVTIEVNKDGTRTMYDPSGNIVDKIPEPAK